MSSESEVSSKQITGWVKWFCDLEQHHFLCEIDEQFLKDSINLFRIKSKFSHYSQAMEMILGDQGLVSAQSSQTQQKNFRFNFFSSSQLYEQARDIYGLIHARWILTPKGLRLMKQKYLMGKFGICPRALCEKQNVLPIGMSEQIRTSRVKAYCPKCQDIFVPKKKCPDIDGACFGCSFPHILLMTYEDTHPTINQSCYIPRIYGLKIYKQKGSKYQDQKQIKDISYYSEEHLKNIKGMKDKNTIIDKKETN